MTEFLWYVGRGTGVMSLVLFSAVVVLGVLTRGGRAFAGLPRFGVAALHRSLSLLSVLFLVVHIVTLLFDPYAQLSLLDVVVPGFASYEPFWQAMGTLALDLVVLLVATSLLRHRLSRRLWKALHWTAYLCWPMAVAHGLGTGTDAGTGWMLALTGACVAAVLGAVAWRVLRVTPPTDRTVVVPTPISVGASR